MEPRPSGRATISVVQTTSKLASLKKHMGWYSRVGTICRQYVNSLRYVIENMIDYGFEP